VLVDGVFLRRPVPTDTIAAKTPAELDILSINIMTGNPAMQMYGSRAFFGVISIATPPPCRADGLSPVPGVRCRAR
jgi:hypothetical protein